MARDECPTCGERDRDRLVWIDDDRVRCLGCQTVFDPTTGQAAAAEADTRETSRPWGRLLAAAEALLAARANQMVTAVEWRELREAVEACGGLADPGSEPDGTE